jgi:hypothetical protein
MVTSLLAVTCGPGSNRKFPFLHQRCPIRLSIKWGESVLLTGMMGGFSTSELENLPEVMIFKIQMDSDPAQAAMLRFRAGIQEPKEKIR